MKLGWILGLSLTVALNATAAENFNCEESAVGYITHIASAPYVKHGERVSAKELTRVSRKAIGDGAESYEIFVYSRKGSNEVYTLKLYVEEIGGVCPLQEYKVSAQ